MGQFIFFEQGVLLDQLLNNARVGFEHRLALQIAGFRGESSFWVYRRHDRQAVAHADFVVFLAMTRGDMDAAGALILRHVVAKHNLRLTVEPGMPANDAFEFGAGPGAGKNFIILGFQPIAFITLSTNSWLMISSPLRGFNPSVYKLGMYSDRLVRR